MRATMAVRAEESGVKRASTDPITLLALSVLAGAFISFGAIFAPTVSAGVTIGNIVGGSIMVAAVYWFVYLRKGSG
jgi:formate transporter